MVDSGASPLTPPSPRLVDQTTSDTQSRRPKKLFSLPSGFSKSCLETISSETVKIYMDEGSISLDSVTPAIIQMIIKEERYLKPM